MMLLSLALLLAVAGCADQKTPDLLELDSVGPGALEPDSELRISGNGFPENRKGTLVLTGIAHTPARPPRHVTWEFPLVADSRTSIVVRPTRRALGQHSEGAPHVTFRGSARIEFAPLVEGRPALRGSKNDLVLDLFVPRTGSKEDPAAFLSFLGLQIASDFTVTELVKDSIAASAGLRLGDRLHTLDGVRLDTTSDFLPQARARMSVLEYSRKGYKGTAQTQLDRSEFQLMDHVMAARALAMVAGISLALLWVARPPRFLVWLVGHKSRARKGKAVWLSGLGTRSQALAYPIFLSVVLGYWWLLSGFEPQLFGVDFLASLSVGAVLLLISSFILGGERTRGTGFSLLGALSGALLRLVILIPIIVGALARASEAGSLRLHEIATDQGALPSDWALFESPFSFLLGMCFLTAVLPLSGRRPPLEGHPGAGSSNLVFARVAEWAGHLVLLGLWAVLFAGGAQGFQAMALMGGVLLSAKVALITHLISWVRARTGHLRMSEAWGFFGFGNLAVAMLAAALSFGFTVSGIQETHAEILGVFSATLAGSLAILLFISSQRSWAHMGRRIDPWI